jgi:tRNA dimethylallyltransferase
MMLGKDKKNLVLAILGSTASGKSSLAIEVAKKFGGVIINCDSRQIYEGMFIGTASPSFEEKKRIDHRLFNFITPNILFNASDFAKLAVKEIKKVWSENKLPVLVGGTGFYYSAISEGLGEAGSDSEIASELQQELSEKGLPFMVEKLKNLDNKAANSIDINNSRRVLRAIEVVLSTGKPFFENKPKQLLPEAFFYPIVVSRPRDVLHKRIEKRIDQMFVEGLEKEVVNIIHSFGRNAAGLSSIGYREWLDYFDEKITEQELKELILVHTRQYAKRQETWFRKKPGVPFTDLEKVTISNVIDKINETFKLYKVEVK